MAPMEKLKKLNYHNSGYAQDRVVIFGSRVGLSGMAYLKASFKFTPDDPCCHGNELWDKIGYNSVYIRNIREIFVYNKGLSGSGYWMMPEKFYRDQPLLPWQRNFRQNRLYLGLYTDMYVGPFFKIQSNPIHQITDPIQSNPP